MVTFSFHSVDDVSNCLISLIDGSLGDSMHRIIIKLTSKICHLSLFYIYSWLLIFRNIFFWLRSEIDCQYWKSIIYVTYIVDFQYWQWTSERSLWVLFWQNMYNNSATLEASNLSRDFLRACESGDMSRVCILVDKYKIRDWSHFRHFASGDTALHVAARAGNLNMVKYLYECFDMPEFKVNVTNKDMKRPLHEAAQFAQDDVLKYLLGKGIYFICRFIYYLCCIFIYRINKL